MTSLFGVMLALFVLSFWLLTVRYKMSAEKWTKVQELEASVKSLADEKYFVYQKEYKRHVFREEVRFEAGETTIAQQYWPFMRAAGKRISDLVEGLRKSSDGGTQIKYVIIIEGMASRDGYANNYELSYQRALALYRFWQAQGIVFDANVCEVIIAGSGTEGVGRFGPKEEARNQRFLIQILPKVGAEGFSEVSE